VRDAVSNVDPVAVAKALLAFDFESVPPMTTLPFGMDQFQALARVVIAAESVVKNAKVFCPSVDEHATGAFASQDDMWVALDALAAALHGEGGE
jgi:hypothetical protein